MEKSTANLLVLLIFLNSNHLPVKFTKVQKLISCLGFGKMAGQGERSRGESFLGTLQPPWNPRWLNQFASYITWRCKTYCRCNMPLVGTVYLPPSLYKASNKCKFLNIFLSVFSYYATVMDMGSTKEYLCLLRISHTVPGRPHTSLNQHIQWLCCCSVIKVFNMGQFSALQSVAYYPYLCFSIFFFFNFYSF